VVPLVRQAGASALLAGIAAAIISGWGRWRGNVYTCVLLNGQTDFANPCVLLLVVVRDEDEGLVAKLYLDSVLLLCLLLC
jgi:hypothetical protein